MAKKFSISEGMLNGISKNTRKVEEFQAKENFKIEYINIDRIRRNEKNFYEIVDIEALAEDIKLNGLNHNLVVRKLDNDMYELISGERRYTALSKLVNEGNKEFNLVPCKVIESNDIDSEIILIQANAQSRELTEVEKLTQVERLQELYKIKKKNGEKVPGKIRDIIANDLNLSATQVGRYERINNKLIPELKAVIEQGNLTIANASEFSSLSEENQRVILNLIDDKANMSKQEAIDLKNKLKKIEEEKELELKKADFESPIAECYDLYFNGIDGARIYAKFMKPKEVKGKMPALLEFHGYEERSNDWSNNLHYVASGICVAVMECRGQDYLKEDSCKSKSFKSKGHIVRGLVEGREKLLFKNIFLDTAILARIVMNMECVDEERVFATGGSQGGALALACAALENRIKGVYAYYPFLCDYKRIWVMDLGGDSYEELIRYFKFIDPNHENEEYVFNTLGYIDIKNMVHRIKGKVNMAIGLRDDICPPSIQFAAYNNILCEKELVLYDGGQKPYFLNLKDKIYKWAINL